MSILIGVSILNMKLHFTTFSMHRLLFLYAKLNHKVGLLSIEKQDRENYLFEDYCLKSGIKIWILALRMMISDCNRAYRRLIYHQLVEGSADP